MNDPVHVMVAILRDRAGRILITRRPPGKPQAGRWEFPGGKLELSESPEACLRRELHEELGVVAGAMQRLIVVEHQYREFRVRLDVREIASFGGEARAREGQQLKWVRADDLLHEDILEADRPIIQALRLPDVCLVTPDPATMSADDFLQGLDASLANGMRLVQLRAPSLAAEDYIALAHEVLATCRAHGARLVLNAPPDMLDFVPADGIHLSSSRLMQLRNRPVPARVLLSAACHDATQLAHANLLLADLAFVSPVKPTPTHAALAGIGWAGFSRLAHEANMPVYALGGMTAKDVARARENGGRGVAGIRGFWRGSV